jgi:hypothetical protein
LYLDLVCPYNGRDFSYPQDALNGIMGILNALSSSFPGGFVSGLPRVFLDHALLWQPFGLADRRRDRRDDDMVHSSLPSWSWCGWQCFVDPYSLRSGLSYIDAKECEDLTGSWLTRNLVEWRTSTTDQTSRIEEPVLTDRYADATSASDIDLPHGWRQHANSQEGDPRFVHAKDDRVQFRRPVPIKQDFQPRHYASTISYLTCTTTTASLRAVTRLEKQRIVGALPKMLVFENPVFGRGPTRGNCPILVLHAPNGGFAGLLRLPNYYVDQMAPIELIAISRGSATATDIQASMEWRVFERLFDTYRDGDHVEDIQYESSWINNSGKSALLVDIWTAFSREMAIQECTVQELVQRMDGEAAKQLPLDRYGRMYFGSDEAERRWKKDREDRRWMKIRNIIREHSHTGVFSQRDHTEYESQALLDRMRCDGSWQELLHCVPKSQRPRQPEKVTCEFYNVLWIERKDGIAYRRACGWVPKYVWEAYATSPIEITLG